jgi:hypothetical protein
MAAAFAFDTLVVALHVTPLSMKVPIPVAWAVPDEVRRIHCRLSRLPAGCGTIAAASMRPLLSDCRGDDRNASSLP